MRDAVNFAKIREAQSQPKLLARVRWFNNFPSSRSTRFTLRFLGFDSSGTKVSQDNVNIDGLLPVSDVIAYYTTFILSCDTFVPDETSAETLSYDNTSAKTVGYYASLS